MKKKIIVLRGRPKTGKTCTLIKVCEKLQRLNKYPIEIINKCERLPADINKGEIKDIYCIVRINGVNIGILTHGDIKAVIKEYIEKFKKNDCKIIICATRTHGKTTEAIEGHAGYIIDPLGKKRVDSKLNSEHEKANDAKAEVIVAKVEEAINLCHETQ